MFDVLEKVLGVKVVIVPAVLFAGFLVFAVFPGIAVFTTLVIVFCALSPLQPVLVSLLWPLLDGMAGCPRKSEADNADSDEMENGVGSRSAGFSSTSGEVMMPRGFSSDADRDDCTPGMSREEMHAVLEKVET